MPDVRFNLKNRNENSTLVSAVFRYEGKRLVYSTGQKISPKVWNDNEQKARETFKFVQYPEFNAYLKKIENEIQNIYRRYKTDGKALSIDQFKKELDISLRKTGQDSPVTLFQFIDDLINTREQALAKPKGSIQVYKKSFKHLKEFSAYSRRKIDFENIDLNFLEDFLEYLYMPPRCLSINYAQKIIQNLKLFLNEATERGYNKNNAFKSKRFTLKKEDTENIYLTIEELNKIRALDLTNNPRIDRVRDLFLIGCFTGLRFSDFTTLKSDHIRKVNGVEIIEVVTQKKNERVSIPMHPIVKDIFTKYKGNIPPALSNQKMNEYLKELGATAKLNDPIVKVRTKGGKRTEESYLKNQLISTHTARRSFATNAFKAGVPVISIKKITGHSTESSFMKYIKINNEENAVLMASNPFFLNQE